MKHIWMIGIFATLWSCVDDTRDLAGAVPIDAQPDSRAAAPAWRRATSIGSTSFLVPPQIVADPSGTVTAMWSENNRLRVSRRPASSSTWSSSIITDAPSRNEQIGVDGSGAVTVLWQQDRRSAVWTRRFVPDTGWGAPQRLSPGDSDARVGTLAVSSNGDAVAVWPSVVSGGLLLLASHFTAAAGWDTPRPIESAVSSIFDVRVAIDAEGNVTALWEKVTAEQSAIMTSRLTAGRWTPPEMLAPRTSPIAMEAVADSVGNAIAVWVASGTVTARRFTPEGGWGMAQPLGSAGAFLHRLRVAVNARGTAVVAWHPGAYLPLMAARFTASNGWEPTTPVYAVDPQETSTTFVHGLALDASDRAYLVWDVCEGSSFGAIRGSTMIDGEWGPIQPVSINPAPAFAPAVAVGLGGEVTAVWLRRDAPHLDSLVVASGYE